MFLVIRCEKYVAGHELNIIDRLINKGKGILFPFFYAFQ